MLTRLCRWQRRHSSLVTGLLMTFLWTCLGIASASVMVKIGLFPVALWKLFDTLNTYHMKLTSAKEETPHIGGGINSSVASLDKEHAHA